MTSSSCHLFCFGFGYSAEALARLARGKGWAVAGTGRTAERVCALAEAGIEAVRFDTGHPLENPRAALSGVTHVLVSVPPDDAGDAVLNAHRADLAALSSLRWIGYLSTTGVYGDTGGAWVDETAPAKPTSARSRQRADAERAWFALGREHGLPVHVFRLAGIYGPGRSALDQVRAGTARRIDRPDHLFSRIHVDDIARVLMASIAKPRPGAVYNVCDDTPATPAAVIEEACRLLGLPPPPLVPFDDAAKTMSPMALSFWRDNRRVVNRRIKEELGVVLKYPNYRAGLRAVLQAGG